MKQINKKTNIGIDSLEMTIKTNKLVKTIEGRKIYSPRTGAKVGEVKAVLNDQAGFKIQMNIPRLIRSDNLKPFGIVDKINLEEVVNEISEMLSQVFSSDMEQCVVTNVEVNSTAELKDTKTVECIMNLLSLMFLQEGKKVFFTAHGKEKSHYKNVPLSYDILRNTYQIESLKTPRLGNKRFFWKIYDKSLEENITDMGYLRIEQVHNRTSLQHEGIPNRLDLFLTADNVIKLVRLFQVCFRDYFLNIYWMHGENCFTDKCLNTVLYELKTEKPMSVAKICRELISCDFEIFSRACRLHYKNRKVANNTIRRVKNSGSVEVNEGTISELVKIFRAILYSN